MKRVLSPTVVCLLGALISSATHAALFAAPPLQVEEKSPTFDLSEVHGSDRFGGSQDARRLLEQNGFVVTDEQFRQIFEAYLTFVGPRRSLPKFVTADSAWHTYHVLLEESVRRLEERQATVLAEFSERLYRQASVRRGKINGGDAEQAGDVHRDLTLFAAVGWALQRPDALKQLEAGELAAVEQTVALLQRGGPPRRVLFFGLPAMPDRYNAASFYAKSPWLADYFAARQWYATMVFRLASDVETERAIRLAQLVLSDEKLAELHRQLNAPYDTLLGPADDATVDDYAATAAAVFSRDTSPEKIAARLDDFRKAAAQLPVPQVNDQLLTPGEYARFAELTKGFRLLPPRRIPSAVLFTRTVDPAVKGRMFPSGMDVFATGPLASEAGRAALNQAEEDPAVAAAVLGAEPAPLPDSLHGQALKLLTKLQAPLPGAAPKPLRTEAWQGKQLWTQLGAWAEQRHTWALHTKLTVEYLGGTMEPPGYVSPYPDFFRGLASLARETAAALRFVECDRARADRAGRLLLDFAAASRRMRGDPDRFTPEYEYVSDRLWTIGRSYRKEQFEPLARRWIAGDDLTKKDHKDIDEFLAEEIDLVDYLEDFAKVCDRLAQIADEQLAGKPLDDSDAKFIMDYGPTLAKFHFYDGNSYLTPRDDFPMVVPVFSSPPGNRNELLYAGLGRPEAVYVIVDVKGKPTLHRGAVLSYREFRLPPAPPINDEGWTQMIRRGEAPPPPEFTTSFRRTMTEKELIGAIREGRCPPQLTFTDSPAVTSAMIEALIAGHFTRNYWFGSQIFRQAGDEHVAGLLTYLGGFSASRGDLKGDAFDVARCLEKLDLSPHREMLFELLHHEALEVVDAAAYLLGKQPEKLDTDKLATHFERGQPAARRLVCYLLGCLAEPGEKAAVVLHRALHDKSAAVRYQAIVTLLNWHKAGVRLDELSPRLIARLTKMPRDDNLYVGSAATRLIIVLEKKETAPDLVEFLAGDLYERWEPTVAYRCLWEIKYDPGVEPPYGDELELLALGTESFPPPPGERVEMIDDGSDGLFGWSHERDPNIVSLEELPAELISALTVFDHKPAVPHLTKMLRSFEDMDQLPRAERFITGFSAEAFDALTVLQPELQATLFMKVAADPSADWEARFRALDHIAASGDPALAGSLLPLLTYTELAPADDSDDTPFCVDAATAIASFIERTGRENEDVADLRQEAVRRITLLLATKVGPDAAKALAKIHGVKAVERMADIALSRDWPVNTRAEALRQFGDVRSSLLRIASEGVSFTESGEVVGDLRAVKLPSTKRVRRQVKRLLPLLDDRTRLERPDDEENRLCDIAALALAEAADLDDWFPDGSDQAARDKFVRYVHESLMQPRKN